ncbi:response regulator transcription factor [Paenibacillus sp. ACRRX]|uniref:response regulator transcription factor n=1 Tax=unclassified Paenibacillus TaxID=185978 RepID=UPI001EF72B9D|nr:MULTISPECIES: response regulator transcription factor [unclassified Paenibacillus]MCG7408091.1 response regulator transcription factor [Paenibacillus sp. ACRRX]MDK8181526.1 response regulator transcription factor [Paenibacillus sp. UMB4589-SE434]
MGGYDMYDVFLVDDEPFIIEGLQSILEWNDYGLTIVGQAENGEEAWKQLQERPVDLVVTDIMMPKMTGLQLIEKVKGLHPQTRFIILSGYNEFVYVKEGIKLGVENYLLKPINLEEFCSTLETTVQKLDQTLSHKQAEQHNRDILRDNVLYRWIRDQIHLEELQQRAELLGIRFVHPYYWTILIRTESDNGLELDMDLKQQEKLAKGAQAFVKEFAEGYCIREWDGEIALVIGLNQLADKTLIAERLILWKLDMEKQHDTALQVTTGSVQSGYALASVSYSHAKQVQPYHLVKDEDSIIDYEETLNYRSSRPSSVQPDINPYVKLLYAKDKEGIHRLLDDDFERLRVVEGAEPRDIRNFAVELLIAWKQSINDEALHASEGEQDWFDAVYRIQSIQALKEHLEQAAVKLIDLLNQPQDMSPVVKQVLQHIDDRYAEELSLKTLSQVYNINPVYLGQLFQKEVQCTFSDYLNKTRIKMAKQMLIETNYRMTDIAEKVGYWDKSYFYKQFKKYVGISPKEYREIH